MQDFRRLKVWEKSHSVAIEIFRLTESVRRRDGIALSAQLRRAALSVPANIAEGAGKASNAEYYRYLQIALGSASETLAHLLLARDIGVLAPARYEELASRVIEVRRMLTGLSKRVAEANALRATPFTRTSSGRSDRSPPNQPTLDTDD